MNRRRIVSSGGRSVRSWTGAKRFIDLSDVPANYTGAADKFVVVNHGETGLIFIPLPPLAITDTYVVNSQVAMLALAAQTGDVAVRTDTSQTFILQGADPTILANWVQLLFPALAAHDLAGIFHNADTITNLNLKLSDGDIISTKAGELAVLAAKAVPTTADILVIEDAAAANAKKQITIANLPAAAPAAHDLAGALHNADTITNLNLKLSDGDIISTKAGEISAIANKAAPVAADLLLIEDSADGNKKKNILISALPTGAAHDLAGVMHNADTITNLNTKLSDGDIISTKAAEVSAMAEKTTAVKDDLLMLEDSAAANAKKKIKLDTLGLGIPQFTYQIENTYPNQWGTNTDYPYALSTVTRNKRTFPSAKFIGNADCMAFAILQRHDYYDHPTHLIDIDLAFMANTASAGAHTARLGVAARYVSDGIDFNSVAILAINGLSDYQNMAIANNEIGIYRKALFSGINVSLLGASTWDTHGILMLFFARYATHADDDYSAGGLEIISCATEYSLKATTP